MKDTALQDPKVREDLVTSLTLSSFALLLAHFVPGSHKAGISPHWRLYVGCEVAVPSPQNTSSDICLANALNKADLEQCLPHSKCVSANVSVR